MTEQDRRARYRDKLYLLVTAKAHLDVAMRSLAAAQDAGAIAGLAFSAAAIVAALGNTSTAIEQVFARIEKLNDADHEACKETP